MVEEKAACDGCPVGGSKTAERIAEILGIEVVETAPYRVVVRCGAKTQDKKGVVQYEGVESCVEAHVVGVTQACTTAAWRTATAARRARLTRCTWSKASRSWITTSVRAAGRV